MMNEESYLIDPLNYNPDTLDLNADTDARLYWFNCFNDLVKKFANQAAKSQCDDPTSINRARDFERNFIDTINSLKTDTERKDSLSIRTLLELNGSYLKLHGFNDPWSKQKELENSASIQKLSDRLAELDKFDVEEKWIELFKGILAGNMFDWGAQAVTQIIENNQSFGLHDALCQIQPRPWLIDGLDEWLKRLQGPPHKCAAIFVDNCGVDIVLGVIPFARQLLLRDTKVLLCANSEPALNDITVNELTDVIEKCCNKCTVIQRAWNDSNLLVYGNGQQGPCLDMRRISPELLNAIVTNETDLLVIEGMGRALHTNLYAKFKCETLKLAVVKNKWWANRLGGDIFSIICKYETV